MNVLSLFDGISVARVALEKAGIKVDKYYASEIDEYAIKIAKKNYPDVEHLGSVVGLLEKNELPQIDLLIGGSPCQDLSIAKRNRTGLDGVRSGLFYEYVKILHFLKPKWFILENVNSMSKESKNIISEIMGVEPVMINASLVSAQNRKRLFWTNIPGITQPEDRGIYLKDILETGDVDRLKGYAIDASYYKGANWDQYKRMGRRQLVVDKPIRVGQFNSGGQGDRIYSPKGKSVSLSANGGGRGALTGLYCVGIIPESIKPKGNYLPRERVFSAEGKFRAVSTVSNQQPYVLAPEQVERLKYLKGAKKEKRVKNGFEYEYSEGALKLTQEEKSLPLLASGGNSISRTTNFINEGDVIRKLTPIECERLQSLPMNKTSVILTMGENNTILKVWLDHQKIDVYAGQKCLSEQNVVGNVERSDSQPTARFVAQSLPQNYQQNVGHVLPDVLISLSEEQIVLSSPKKLFESAIIVEKKQASLRLNQKEDFARQGVGMRTILEKIIYIGREGLLRKNNHSAAEENGESAVSLCGEEITQHAKDAETNSIIPNRLLRSIISSHSGQIEVEPTMQTLFCSVVHAIRGYIPVEISEKNFSTFQITVNSGYTEGVSNTQRYKCIGNAFNADVVAHILSFIPKEKNNERK